MKIVMTLLVRNEDDILEDNLIFHKKMGVNFFVVTDHLSTDGTADILTKYASMGWLRVITETTETYNQGAWVTNMARMAYTEHGADWVINNDADEFWMPDEGTLVDLFQSLPDNVGTIHFNRLDFHYRPFRDAKFYEALLFREWLCRWTKCCHRGVPDVEVEIGNHHAYSKGLSEKAPENMRGGNLRVLHYPIRSFERYQAKMAEGARFILNTPNLPESTGFHWKMALRHIVEGTFEKYFSEKVYSQDRIMEGVKSGSITMDDALQKFFLNHIK